MVVAPKLFTTAVGRALLDTDGFYCIVDTKCFYCIVVDSHTGFWIPSQAEDFAGAADGVRTHEIGRVLRSSNDSATIH